MSIVRTVSSVAIIAATLGVAGPALAKDKLNIELKEWNISTSSETIKAGEVAVSVKNKGAETHEIAIIKLNTDLATGRFPVDKDGGINEDTMNFGKIVGEIEDIESKKSAKETFKLSPGRYAIVCNKVEQEDDGSTEAHYSMGMHAQLTVE